MSDPVEYEDFLPNVRKSLYGKAQLSPKPNENTHRKPKKVKFRANHSPHNGHNSPNQTSEFQNIKSEKGKHRKNTPFKKKNKKEQSLQESATYSHQSEKLKKVMPQQKTPKKRQMVISFSSSSDSFDEELKDTELTPSKSELETFQSTFSKSSKRKLRDMNDSTSEDDENESDFDLETYFNTRESDLNESVIEAHSGIDYEFVSDRARDVKIIESESMSGKKGLIKIVSDSDEADNGSSEDNASQLEADRIEESIVEEIQESMSISDDSSKEASSTSVLESPESQEDTPPHNFGTAEYRDFIDKKLVILKKKQSISFHGLFTLKVLYGKIEVFGHILTSNSNPVNLYSLRGSALLYLRNITDDHTDADSVNISGLISAQNDLETVNDIYIEPNCAAVLCSKLVDSKLLFLEKYVSQRIFPRLQSNNVPQVVFEPVGNLSVIKNSDAWDDILSSVNSTAKLMITGGKGVGKSTLLRYAINKLLSTFDKVRVLDLDPGQSEFTVPGCVSVVTVAEPIFGPNFTHLKQTNRSLLCNINVGHDPRAYVKCIKSIASYMETLEGEYPILINYMGFVQGIGLNLVASAIQYIQPTGIIQICSRNIKKNFRDDLKYKIVKEHCQLFCVDHETPVDGLVLNYTLYKVPAMNDGKDGWTLGPRESREMCVLTYFGQMMRNGVNSLTSHGLPMYEVKLSSIKITNLQGDEILPAVVNANMVALCSLEPELNIFVCKGYGVVRCIDLECDKLILLTPEPATVIEDVHYLVMGSVFLPPAIYMTPDGITGTIPYVMEGELVSFAQITKRTYLPVSKK